MKKLFISLLLILFLPSCIKDSSNTDLNETYSSFKMIPVPISRDITKAGIAVNEDIIKDLWVLQFNGTAPDSKLVKSVYISDIAEVNKIVLQLISGSDQKVEFIANTFDSGLFNSSNAPLGVFSNYDFKNKKRVITGESTLLTGVTSKYIQLYGSYSGVIPNRSSVIPLLHNCAKVTLNYISEDVSHIANGIRFKISSVQVKNIPSEATYTADHLNSTLTNSTTLIDYNIISGSNYGTGTGQAYNVGNYSGTVTFYIPENISGDVLAVNKSDLKPMYAPVDATYLEIKGLGVDTEGNICENVKFLLYLGNNNTSNYDVNINSHYTLDLTFRGVNILDSRMEVQRISNIMDWITQIW